MIAFHDAAAVHAALPYAGLVEALRAAFGEGAEVPVRHHHAVARPGQPDAVLLLMPAWQVGGTTGVKIVHICSGNETVGKPSVQGLYLLFDGPTGTPLAVMDGAVLTVRRTAAASALASSYLSRPDSERLLVIGAGALAGHLARAHAAVRPIRETGVWNRSPERARAIVAELRTEGLQASAVDNLESALAHADIVTCGTMSDVPLVRGAWLRPGTHVDLVGAYTPSMRESDDDTMRRATVFVDTRAGALAEAGDILQAIAAGAMTAGDIAAELAGLCRGEHAGRSDEAEITVFKSVGYALEDLVAARMVAGAHNR